MFERPFAQLGLATALLSSALGAQDRSAATAEVFRRYADHVVKIQVVEASSGAKSTIGSGFFATAAGDVVTNYHVISSLIDSPERYRAELIDPAGTTLRVTVLAIDAVHDLAILGTGLRGRPHFAIAPVQIAQGTRLFSLGNPNDLGLSIVEGTYNGLLLHTLYPRIHLTASLNRGMSGGPTIDDQGRVIGVNVSTQGNQVSFLVPVDRAADLLRRATGLNLAEAPSLLQIGRQLRAHQDLYLRDMFDTATKRLELGPFRVVTQPAPFFRCWGDATRDWDLPYEQTQHNCATDDNIYLGDDQTTGTVTVAHRLIATKRLNTPRFFALYTSIYSADIAPSGEEEHVTNWKCVTRNVRDGVMPMMRAVLCLRRYHKLGELYDGMLKVAVLGRSDTGLVSTLNMTGVTFANVQRLSERYLRLIAWR